jgi:hypothetical protein
MPTGRPTKRAVSNDLAAMLPTGDKQTDDRISHAIDHLTKSLHDKLWVDDLALTKKGKKVFNEEKKAVRELLHIQEDTVETARPEENAADLLVGVDRDLAQRAIDEAVAAGGDLKEITHAQKELARAQDEFDRGRPDHAIDHYKHAWDHAEKAINKNPEPDTEEKPGDRQEILILH